MRWRERDVEVLLAVPTQSGVVADTVCRETVFSIEKAVPSTLSIRKPRVLGPT